MSNFEVRLTQEQRKELMRLVRVEIGECDTYVGIGAEYVAANTRRRAHLYELLAAIERDARLVLEEH